MRPGVMQEARGETLPSCRPLPLVGAGPILKLPSDRRTRMLTRTTETALRALVFIALEGKGRLIPFSEIAQVLGGSQTYLAKVMGLLVKHGILKSQRGTQGGVSLERPLNSVRLLDIVEACQGILTADYCRDLPGAPVCAFHAAMVELHEATVKALSRWTLEDLAGRPMTYGKGSTCKMLMHLPDTKRSVA